MKNLFLFLCFLAPFLIYEYYNHQKLPESDQQTSIEEHQLEKIKICKNRATQSKSSSLTFLGESLLSNSSNPTDLVLCPGDAFGDLNDTYITVKNCYLEMYHQSKILWSSKVHPQYLYLQLYEGKCAFSVEKDGNLALYLQGEMTVFPEGRAIVSYQIWDSQTNLNPMQTEVKLHKQKIQIIQIFEDGTQRKFYVDEKHQDFIEDLGEAVKKADKFVIKDHQDEDKTILRRNEYIGDLNGTHLILQTNCELQLLNKDKIIWSFMAPFQYERSCVLNVQDRDHIAISKIPIHQDDQEDFKEVWQSIITKPKDSRDYQIIQSQLSFEENQPIIIQTLQNGSRITYSSGPGKDSALKPKKEPSQIAEKALLALQDFSMERMDYIGNLTDLHLILEQNCSLILANGDEKLWEFYGAPQQLAFPVMDCSILMSRSGFISFEKDYLGVYRQASDILKGADVNQREFITGLELTLENNQLIITRRHSDRCPEIYHAGPNTFGTLLQFISNSSFIINPDVLTLPKMGYIGNINGIFLVFEDTCKWVLYNKTRVIWQSGKNLSEENGCMMVMKKDGKIFLTDKVFDENWLIWYTMKIPPGGLKAYKKVIKTELLVNDGGLWMVHTFKDGNASQYKAVERTNYFGLLSKKDDLFFNSDL